MNASALSTVVHANAAGVPERWPMTGWCLVLMLIAVAVAARIAAVGNPIVQVDEEFYLLVARDMLNGAVPYVDVWDRKPVGLFLIYLLPAMLSPLRAVYAYQTLALASVVTTGLLIVGLTRRVGWGRGGALAAVVYILWLDLADGQGGQAPVFYNLLVVSAVALITRAVGRSERRRAGRIAMLVLGFALQVKYTVLFESAWIGLWLLWHEHRATSSWRKVARYGLALGAIALFPTLAVAAAYAAAGHGDAFLFANFLSIFKRHADRAAEQLDNALTALALLGPLVAMSALGIGAVPATAVQRQLRHFLCGWFTAAIVGFVVFGGWFNHYTLPVMLPGAVCSAAFLSSRRAKRWLVVPAVLVLLVTGQIVVAASESRRGTPAQFAAVIRAIGPGPGTLYVDWGEPAFFTFTGRRALSRYVFPTHLQLAREAGAVGVEQGAEIERIFRKRPDVVVLMGPATETGEDPQISNRVLSLVRHAGCCPPIRLQLGRFWTDVYHARQALPAPPAAARANFVLRSGSLSSSCQAS